MLNYRFLYKLVHLFKVTTLQDILYILSVSYSNAQDARKHWLMLSWPLLRRTNRRLLGFWKVFYIFFQLPRVRNRIICDISRSEFLPDSNTSLSFPKKTAAPLLIRFGRCTICWVSADVMGTSCPTCTPRSPDFLSSLCCEKHDERQTDVMVTNAAESHPGRRTTNRWFWHRNGTSRRFLSPHVQRKRLSGCSKNQRLQQREN